MFGAIEGTFHDSTTPGAPGIRPARPDDWAAIWPLLRAVVERGHALPYPEPLTSEQGRLLWMEEPPGATVVYTHRSRIVGSAKMGPNRPGRGSHVATATFVVDPGFEGRGIGRALGLYALEWAAAAGYRSMQFNAVVESNRRAVALWLSIGFEIIGTVPEAFDHPELGLVGLHVMHRRLEVQAPAL